MRKGATLSQTMHMNPEGFLIAEAGRRTQTDYRFSWGSYFGWTLLTLGIFSVYATYKLIERRNEHIKRKLEFSTYLWHTLAERAGAAGKREEIQEGLDNLSRIHAQIEAYARRNVRNPVSLACARILVLPGAFINHVLNKDFRFLDTWEASLEQNAAWILGKLGHAPAMPARFDTPHHTTTRCVLLSLVTLGVYAVVWRRRMMIEGNLHFDSDDRMEDSLLTALGLASVR